MLCRLYIGALLADSDRAEVVWQAWDIGLITDAEAARGWRRIAKGTAAQQRVSGFASVPGLRTPQTAR
jgi:hypothetical protein